MPASSRGSDPLSPAEREAQLRAPRPRRELPIAPLAKPAKRGLPLADAAREKDLRCKPLYAVWEITLACDLACRHCGSRAGRARPDELSTAECLDLVRQMAELGVTEVSLIGGEAYLREDWLEIVRAVRDHGMLSNLTTGGRGISAAMAEAAAAAGLQAASVSFDGSPLTHDRLRGVDGAYGSALASFRHLRSAGVRTSVNTQINRLTMPELPGVLDLLIEERAKGWQIQLTVAMGRAADEPEVLLQPYDLLDLFPLLAELKTRGDAAGVRMWPGNNIGYFGPYEGLLRGTMPRGHMNSCGAGRSTLGIEANGSVKGCPSLTTEDWTGGNVREHPLADIWHRAPPLRYTRDRTVDELWGYCRDCYYAHECRAGCTWTAEVLFGRPGNNPYCHHRALEFARQGKREIVRKIAEAPGMPFDRGQFEVIIEPLPTAPDQPGSATEPART